MSWISNKKMVYVMCFLVGISVFASPVLARKTAPYDFVKKLLPLNNKTVKKIAKAIPGDALIKKTDIASIRKSLPDINIKRLNPDILKLAAVGGQIAKTSKFANRFINKAPNPADIISQYSKYGKPYLKTAQTFSKTVVTHASDLGKASAKQLKKFGNLSKDTIAKFKNEDFANSAFVSVVRKTGKKGYETIKKITLLAKKYPKSAVTAALLIWYTTDSEGFLDSVKDVSAFAATFGTETVGALTEGAGRGIVTHYKQMWVDPVRQQYLLVGGIFLLAIIILSFRITRRLVFFPFRVVGSRLNTYMDHREANIDKRKPHHANKAKHEKPKAQKVQLKSSPGKPKDKEAKGLF